MDTSSKLDKKFEELEELLLSDGYKKAQERTGVPFLMLLYPPEEEIEVRRRVEVLEKKLIGNGWEVISFIPGPLLFEFLDAEKLSQKAFEAERQDPNKLRSKVVFDLCINRLSEIGGKESPKSVIFVRRAGGFYPHVNIHSLLERLVNKVKKTTVFFIPAIEPEGHQYLFMGRERTQKYRGHYI